MQSALSITGFRSQRLGFKSHTEFAHSSRRPAGAGETRSRLTAKSVGAEFDYRGAAVAVARCWLPKPKPSRRPPENPPASTSSPKSSI